jgi:hypothetical protein
LSQATFPPKLTSRFPKRVLAMELRSTYLGKWPKNKWRAPKGPNSDSQPLVSGRGSGLLTLVTVRVPPCILCITMSWPVGLAQSWIIPPRRTRRGLGFSSQDVGDDADCLRPWTSFS